MNCKIKSKGVSYNNQGDVVTCLFCRIQRKEEPGEIVYEDQKYVVFKTIAPATWEGHLLVTPREHIQSVKTLFERRDGANIVEEMVNVGRLALGEKYAHDAQFCFHIPPFNSIDHLHLHAIACPDRMDSHSRRKYKLGEWFCKSADDIIRRHREGEQLDNGGYFWFDNR